MVKPTHIIPFKSTNIALKSNITKPTYQLSLDPNLLLKAAKEQYPDKEFNINKKGVVVQKFLDRWRPICEHFRRHSICKECGGVSICPHQHIRSTCKECGGGSICPHQRQRSLCKECGGSQICPHQRIKSKCKECGGSEICPHQRIKSKCKECGGGSICLHQRRRSFCKECGGSQICPHQRSRSKCKECGGSEICTHQRIRSKCKECGGSEICPHQRVRSICKECGGGSICLHQRRRSICKECGGSQICPHQRLRTRCKECGGGNICIHHKIRSSCKACRGGSICQHQHIRSKCKDCLGGSICQHQVLKSQCKECNPVECDKCFKIFPRAYMKSHYNLIHGKCENCNLEGTSRLWKHKYCYVCGCHKFGRTPFQKRQDKIFEFIAAMFGEEHELYYDKSDPSLNSSTKARADIRLITPYRTIIIEVDENQHKSSDYGCLKAMISNKISDEVSKQFTKEEVRMNDIASSGDVQYIVFIRFNPDRWVEESNRVHKKEAEIPQERLNTLKEEIDLWLDIDKEQEHFAECVYLFYDGPQRQTDFIPLDISETKNNNNNNNNIDYSSDDLSETERNNVEVDM